jgi:uncharacterized protein YeaO (DUF488 family)
VTSTEKESDTMIRVKRIYESLAPSPDDGRRILVDRLWPRGVSRHEAMLDEWMKDISPSSELRRWFGHDPARWQEFKKRYRQELEGKQPLFEKLKNEAEQGNITLLYAARDTQHNNAVALKEFLTEAGSSGAARRSRPRE